MKIYEIFKSIQGESTYAGYPCTFIRLAGCNLQCSYCDTPPMESFDAGVEEILDKVDLLARQPVGSCRDCSPTTLAKTANCEVDQTKPHHRHPSTTVGQLVEITGGEPLLHKESLYLCQKLLEQGKTVLVETNGSLDIGVIPKSAVVVMDIKTPDSLMSDRMDWDNINRLKENDEVKFVLSSRNDYDWACRKIEEHRLNRRAHLLLSPVYGRLAPHELARWIVEDNLPVRMQLQLHKIIWGPDAKGV